MIEMAVLAYIKSNFSITRVFVGEAPAGTILPCITIDLESAQHEHHYDGNGDVVSGLIFADLELTVWSESILEARQKARALADLLDSFRGTMTTNESPQNSYRVALILVTDENSGFDRRAEKYGASVFITTSYT